MINMLIVACLSEIAFAFERRQQQDQQRLETTTMKTHLDAFWWATSLRSQLMQITLIDLIKNE